MELTGVVAETLPDLVAAVVQDLNAGGYEVQHLYL